MASTPPPNSTPPPYSFRNYIVPDLAYLAVQGLALAVIFTVCAKGWNYIRGRESIPLKGVVLLAGAQAVIHFGLIELHSISTKKSVRFSDYNLTIEKIVLITLGCIFTMPLAYYGTQYLFHQRIKRLPTGIFSVGGALLLGAMEVMANGSLDPTQKDDL